MFFNSPFLFSDELTENLRNEFLNLNTEIENLKKNFLSNKIINLDSEDAGIALLRLDMIEANHRAAIGKLEALEYKIKILEEKINKKINNFDELISSVEEKEEEIFEEDAIRGSIDIFKKDDLSDYSIEDLAFIRIKELYDDQEFLIALSELEKFIESYPLSSNYAEANFLVGEINFKLDNFSQAADKYLDTFVADPSGEFAPISLVGLALCLEKINQFKQACLTISEARARYPEKINEILNNFSGENKLVECQ